jgi:hypothetical protein
MAADSTNLNTRWVALTAGLVGLLLPGAAVAGPKPVAKASTSAVHVDTSKETTSLGRLDLLLIGRDLDRAPGLTTEQRATVKKLVDKPRKVRSKAIGKWLASLPADARRPAADAVLGALIVRSVRKRVPDFDPYLDAAAVKLSDAEKLRVRLGCREGVSAKILSDARKTCTPTKQGSKKLPIDRDRLLAIVARLEQGRIPEPSQGETVSAGPMEVYMSLDKPRPPDGCDATTTEAAVDAQKVVLEDEIEEVRARIGRLQAKHAASVAACIAANPFACIAAVDYASKIAGAERRLAELSARLHALSSRQCVRAVSPSDGSGGASGSADAD